MSGGRAGRIGMTHRRWIKRAGYGLVALAALWGGTWGALAYGARQSAQHAIVAMQQEGIAAGFSDAAVSGFPSRLSLTLADLSMGDTDAILWSTQSARVEAGVTRPNQISLDLSQPHRLSGSFGAWSLDTDQAGVMALFVPRLDVPLADLQLAAKAVRLAGPEMGDITLAALAGRLNDGGTVDGVYAVSLQLQELDIAALLGQFPAAYRMIPSLSLTGDVVFDRAWDRQLFVQGYPVLRGMNIAQLALGFGASTLSASGQLIVEPSGRLSGALSLTVDQWRPLFDLARDLGVVEPGLEDFLIAALDGLAMADNNPDDLTVPLTLRDGLVSFGALTLGMIPATR